MFRLNLCFWWYCVYSTHMFSTLLLWEFHNVMWFLSFQELFNHSMCFLMTYALFQNNVCKLRALCNVHFLIFLICEIFGIWSFTPWKNDNNFLRYGVVEINNYNRNFLNLSPKWLNESPQSSIFSRGKYRTNQLTSHRSWIIQVLALNTGALMIAKVDF